MLMTPCDCTPEALADTGLAENARDTEQALLALESLSTLCHHAHGACLQQDADIVTHIDTPYSACLNQGKRPHW